MELLADGSADRQGIHETKRAARSVCDEHGWGPDNPDQEFEAFEFAERHTSRRAAENVYRLVEARPLESAISDAAVRLTVYDFGSAEEVSRWRARLHVVAAYLRDIFGNPFRPVAFDTAWRTENTVGLAARLYEERDFAAMPILADALEESGCDNPDILSHCREPGVHVRGCWVVDLVLGKG